METVAQPGTTGRYSAIAMRRVVGTPKHVERVLLARQKLAVVPAHAFDGIAALDSPTARAEGARLLFRGVSAEDDMPRGLYTALARKACCRTRSAIFG